MIKSACAATSTRMCVDQYVGEAEYKRDADGKDDA